MRILWTILKSPITQFNLLVVGSLVLIQSVHLHAHHTMEVDVDSYVTNFCKKNVDKCERILDNDY